MIYMIFGILLGVFFFIATIKAYTLGIKHGKQLSNAIVPKIDLNPVTNFKQYVQAKEIKKERDLAQEGLQAIATYDPYNVKEGE